MIGNGANTWRSGEKLDRPREFPLVLPAIEKMRNRVMHPKEIAQREREKLPVTAANRMALNS